MRIAKFTEGVRDGLFHADRTFYFCGVLACAIDQLCGLCPGDGVAICTEDILESPIRSLPIAQCTTPHTLRRL